jgi:hypothetical protein
MSPSSGVANDFTFPATYTVTAADASIQPYTVTVTVAASMAKAITEFGFAGPAATGIITESTHTIAVTVPFGTAVAVLVPTIVHTGASISPASGVANDFTLPATYTVTAADASTQPYTVTVTVAVAVLWTKLLGVTGSSTLGHGIAVDLSGNGFITGETDGDLDGKTRAGTIDCFITKYDTTGMKSWTKLHGSALVATIGYGISTDSSGNIYVTGSAQGPIDGETFPTDVGGEAVFIIKYDSSGNRLWTKLRGLAGTTSPTWGTGIAVDSSGNSYIAGTTLGPLDGQPKTGNSGVFVMKYDTSGNWQWTRILSATLSTYGRAISVDSTGNSYVTGDTQGNLGGETKTGSVDGFVTKYDASGNIQWTKLFGAAGEYAKGYGISTDSTGNSYVTGSVSQNTLGALLDGQAITGTSDVLAIKYDTSGAKQWTRLLGVAGQSTKGYSISADSSGSSYVTGETGGSLDGQTFAAGTGNQDVFVIKYGSSGAKDWTRLLGVSGTYTTGMGIALNSSGTSHVTGYTGGNLDEQTLTGMDDVFITTRLNP